MSEFLQTSNYLLFLYYLGSNMVYLALLAASIMATLAQQRRLKNLWLDRLRASSLAPPISVLVPAHNEERNIVQSVQSLLALDYPELEVVVVNDGSTDDTLGQLTRQFELTRTDMLHVSEIPTEPVRAVYMSNVDHRLMVLDKQSNGRKADALNAALNAASSPFVCAIDADAILEKDALLRIMFEPLWGFTNRTFIDPLLKSVWESESDELPCCAGDGEQIRGSGYPIQTRGEGASRIFRRDPV